MTSSDIIERRIILYMTLNLSYFQNNTIGLNRAYGRLSNRKTHEKTYRFPLPVWFGATQTAEKPNRYVSVIEISLSMVGHYVLMSRTNFLIGSFFT